MKHKLSYKIGFPENLKEIYEYLQSELNRVLSNEETRKAIENIDNSLLKAKYWKELRNLIGEDTQYKWKRENRMPNPAWYFCSFAEQIRQLHKSLKDQIKLYRALQLFNNETSPEFYQYCIDNSIQFSRTKVRNMQRCKEAPGLPNEAKFVLDFAFINKQACYIEDNSTFKYLINKEDGSTEWYSFPILIHSSSRYQSQARISKPKFSKDRNGNYYGVIAFDYEGKEFEDGNIGAIDLGKINLYTFSYIRPDGIYSQDYYKHSKYLERLNKKVESLYLERDILIEKNKEVDRLFLFADYIPKEALSKWTRRSGHIERINTKISNLKETIAMHMANEILELCQNNNCTTLFMEELNWLETTGGKWNHSAQQTAISRVLLTNGIDVYKVNAKNTSKEHPITSELGKVSGRDIVWSNGERLNRDYLSTLNQLQRIGMKKEKQGNRVYAKKKNGYKITKLRDKHSSTPKQMKKKKSNRKEKIALINSLLNKNNNRTNQMVLVRTGSSEQLLNDNNLVPTCSYLIVDDKESTKEKYNSMLYRFVHKRQYLYSLN